MTQRQADEIEREIHRRFSDQVYVGMSVQDYHSALTHVIIRYVAEHLAADGETLSPTATKETP